MFQTTNQGFMETPKEFQGPAELLLASNGTTALCAATATAAATSPIRAEDFPNPHNSSRYIVNILLIYA